MLLRFHTGRKKMSRTIKIAAVQMNAMPAPLEERLARAESLIARCAPEGAQLVVLPEVFNIGYEYSDRNYSRAETFDGPTATWMRKTAAQFSIHLAGTFLRAAQNDIYNTMLLAAPGGHEWHYDKNYPWFWERAYFRKGTGITIADTDLGKIGLLICWDVAHTDLWQQYAGQVELMLVSSCPPKAFDLDLLFPGDKRIRGRNMGALVQYIKRSSDETFARYLRRQTTFLGVPLAQATSTGTFTSGFPAPKRSMAMLALMAPSLWKYVSRAGQARIETDYFNETYIADGSGTLLERVQPGVEGYTLSDVTLPDGPPQPVGKQPAFGIPAIAYLVDGMSNRMFAAEYRKRR